MRKEGLLDLNEAVQHPGKRLVFNFTTSLSQEQELELVEPVAGHIEAYSTGNQLMIEATCRAVCIMDCARCGSALEVQFDFDMEDNFDVDGIPSAYASDSYAKVVSDEPFPLFDHNALVRDTYVRQGLWVNLPTQPLCQHGWEGDCPNAAAIADYVEEPEVVADINPAFSKLKEIQSGEDA